MEYSVGSLAELISGQKTPSKIKVVQKSFTPVKKEPEESFIKTEPPDSEGPKKHKRKNSEKIEMVIENQPLGTESPKKKKYSKKTKQNNPHFGQNKEKSPKIKSPKGKGKLDQSNDDPGNSDAEETTPETTKKAKLSKNETNAASRIKNKLNKETKTSGEYNDKTVFVGNVPIVITKKKLKKHFSKYGVIDSVRIRGIPVADPNTSKKVAAIKKEFHPDRTSVYAFIRFTNTDDAKKAEAENGQLFRDHHLRVHCCEVNDKPDESKAIFVGNLPFNAEDEELWNLFKPCGPISHVRIVRDGRSGMGKGFGYVNFKDSDAVQLALEMEKVLLKDRELRISLCDSSRAKKKVGKKPRIRNKQDKDSENVESSPKKRKIWNNPNKNDGKFSGTKFNDVKKKKKLNKSTLEKKKLAKKLVAVKPPKS